MQQILKVSSPINHQPKLTPSGCQSVEKFKKNYHSMMTRGKSGIFKPKLPFTDFAETTDSLDTTEPHSVAATLSK